MEDHPQLRTPRLLLRPFCNGDVDDVFAYATDPEWGRYLPVPDPYTRLDAEEFVAGCILVDGETRFEWAVVHEGRVSGGITLTVHDPGSAEMGYSIAHSLWGRGLTTEAAQAVITHGFEELGLARIQASADVRNKGSWRVMEKLGMERTGVAHSDRLLGGTRVDAVFYEILREGWSPPQSATNQGRTEGPPELRTGRLLLRPFRMDDVDDVFAYASDSEWNRYLGLPEPYTRRSAEEFVAKCILADSESGAEWAIVHEGRVSGGVNLHYPWVPAWPSWDTASPAPSGAGASRPRPQWPSAVHYGFQELGAGAHLRAFANIRERGFMASHGEAGHETRGHHAQQRPRSVINASTTCSTPSSARSGRHLRSLRQPGCSCFLP